MENTLHRDNNKITSFLFSEGPFRVTSSFLHVFGVWEEAARTPGGNPARLGENMQTQAAVLITAPSIQGDTKNA